MASRQSARCFSRFSARQASKRAPETDKSRILEKPTRFNPPSHGSKRARPRSYPGPRLSDAEIKAQKSKQYPNMMPPEGTFMFYFLTDRRLHLWITLSTLTALATYASVASFLHTTAFRDQLPSGKDFWQRPFSSTGQVIEVYKLHTEHESAKVAAKRKRKVEDAEKRKEFLRQHGVEPGFVTGTWMDKFGTMDQEQARDGLKEGKDAQAALSPAVDAASSTASDTQNYSPQNHEDQVQTKPKKKLKMWFGIW